MTAKLAIDARRAFAKSAAKLTAKEAVNVHRASQGRQEGKLATRQRKALKRKDRDNELPAAKVLKKRITSMHKADKRKDNPYPTERQPEYVARTKFRRIIARTELM
jgi:hypothetical protein